MKINSILIGKGSGSAGNVTVLQLKGQTILKQKASIVSNPNTQLQQNQRKMINRAVYVWQLLGGVLRQGWTSLLPFSSQYNTFVSENAQHFKDATFTKETFINADLQLSVATKGVLGRVQPVSVDFDVQPNELTINGDDLGRIAKAGDKLVLIVGNPAASSMFYAENTITPAMLSGGAKPFTFDNNFNSFGIGAIYTIFVVSADGSKSSTSIWTNA